MVDEKVDIKSIDEATGTVNYTDGTSITYKDFLEKFTSFFNGRIAGETLYPADMERFMRRTSGKNLSLLMKGKKAEGFMEGAMGRMLTKGQKLALGVIFGVVIMIIVVVIVLKNMGIINF